MADRNVIAKSLLDTTIRIYVYPTYTHVYKRICTCTYKYRTYINTWRPLEGPEQKEQFAEFVIDLQCMSLM